MCDEREMHMVSLTVDGKELIATPCYSNRSANAAVCVDCFDERDDYYHYHPEYELHFSQNLSGKRIVGNVVEPFAQTDLILIGPNLPHARLSNGSLENGDSMNVIAAHFTRESIGMELLSRNELRPVRHVLNASRRGVRFRTDGLDDGVVKNIQALPELNLSKQYFRFMEILDTLARTAEWASLLTEEYDLSWAENDELMFQKIQ